MVSRFSNDVEGFTLVEALVALGLTALVVAAALSLLNPNHLVAQTQAETIDMHQRVRAAADAMSRDIMMAGAGLPVSIAPLVPGADSISVAHALAPDDSTRVETRSYYYDAVRSQLRTSDGEGTDAPVTDNVVGLAFDYLSDSGTGALAPVPLAVFHDGPWVGGIGAEFDADVRHVRAVRITIRVQTANAALRATGPAFVRPGTSRSSRRAVADVTATVRVAPRNLNLDR